MLSSAHWRAARTLLAVTVTSVSLGMLSGYYTVQGSRLDPAPRGAPAAMRLPVVQSMDEPAGYQRALIEGDPHDVGRQWAQWARLTTRSSCPQVSEQFTAGCEAYLASVRDIPARPVEEPRIDPAAAMDAYFRDTGDEVARAAEAADPVAQTPSDDATL